ncbi:MAG: type I-U CRISPR-associated protein Csb2 [Acidobacteria bacterium]|nr:type I-U CRISPR-associated protein Csb2 [Acidobacteriota bacterium]
MSRVIVQVNLLSGRYHAHPWGEAQHAMAGPEWPPSPWRLLRGLAAAWFDANPHPFSETERDDLLQALGTGSPPALWLPPVSFAEIPYYQPILTSTPQDRVLHFDHFAVLSEGNEGSCFCFDFDVVLSARQQSVLAQLLARMTYLGRAESRARLSLVDTPSEHLSRVAPADGRSSSGYIRRRVLVARGTFLATGLWAAKSEGGHLVQAMIDAGRKRPPNTDWIDYGLPSALVRRQLARRAVTAPARRPRVAAVRFGLFRRVPIRLPELVQVARAIRDQATTSFNARTGGTSRRLTGRAADGSIATGHQHAFWLPKPDRRTGRLRSLTVWLPDGADGIDQRELDALLGVQHILCDDDYPILVVAERVAEMCPEPTPSRRWQAVTPFLAPLHSRRGRRALTPSEQLQRMMEGITGAIPRVTSVSGSGLLGRLTTVRTHFYQRGTWRWTTRVACWFKLEFDQPVVLPRPVGADAHFGLGQFAPVDAEGGER